MDIQHPKVQLNNMTSPASILLAIISCFVALVQSHESSETDSTYFRLLIGTFNDFEYAPIQKSLEYPGDYFVSTVNGAGVGFKFGDKNILIDEDQQKVFVDPTGEVRIASGSEVATPGFFFDDDNFLKLQGGEDFYLCGPKRGLMGLRMGYKKKCSQVQFYKN